MHSVDGRTVAGVSVERSHALVPQGGGGRDWRKGKDGGGGRSGEGGRGGVGEG